MSSIYSITWSFFASADLDGRVGRSSRQAGPTKQIHFTAALSKNLTVEFQEVSQKIHGLSYILFSNLELNSLAIAINLIGIWAVVFLVSSLLTYLNDNPYD
jgi:hypothetical protein